MNKWKKAGKALLPVILAAAFVFPSYGTRAVSYTHLDVYKRQGLHGDEGVDSADQEHSG